MDRQLFEDLIIASNQHIVEREYWLKKLSGDFQRGYIPYDYALSAQRSSEIAIYLFSLPSTLADTCLRLANGSDHNLYIILYACLAVLVSKYTASPDIVLGSPVLKDDSTGERLNSVIPLRIYLQEDTTFKELLGHLKTIHLEGLFHQNYPIEMLVSHLNLEGSVGTFPLFDIVALFDGLHIQQFFQHKGPALTFVFRRDGAITIHYNTALYEEQTLERLSRQFVYLLQQALEHIGDRAVLELKIDSNDEYHTLIHGLNRAACTFPTHATITQLFEETVARFPNNIAVQYGTTRLTYTELNERSNRLARVLRQRGSQPDTIIGIYAERSIEMIIGLLAILKADAAYLPLDPGYPAERINYILADSQVAIVLTQAHLAADLTTCKELVFLDDERHSSQANSNLKPMHTAQSLAYVIYTSGTTGNPKGVMVEHRQVVRLLRNDAFYFDFNEHDTWTMFHSFCFDFSVWEMYGALLNGGRLIIVPSVLTLDLSSYLVMLKKERVTVLNQTPGAFFLLAGEEYKHDTSDLVLRYVIFGGEALQPGRLKRWQQRYPQTILINMYGITETTVHVTYQEITQADIQADVSTIGRPIPTTSVYILDSKLELVPIGLRGEIFVGGEGVARGYLHNSDLTRQKFLHDPIRPGGRMYRTGDTGRWRNNGMIEYIGRIDQQVKIRGFRIETGEIEARIMQFQGIANAVVVPVSVEQGEMALCAYIVIQSTLDPDGIILELKHHLRTYLPAYMLPAFIVSVAELPLTEHGKLNKSALPDPRQYMKAGTSYMPPGNQQEQQLVAIWAEHLKLPTEQIGIHDRFFDLGGNSLSVLALNNKVQEILNRQIPVISYFQYPTIFSFVEYLTSTQRAQEEADTTFAENMETENIYSMMEDLNRFAEENQTDE